MKSKVKVALMDYTPDPEQKIVAIAKLSHGGDPFKIYSKKEIEIFINKLIDWKHFSVFEHASATFYIKGISLNCSHQFVRHRLFSYLQKSRRYCADDPNFIIPDSLKNNKDVEDLFKKSLNLYNNLIANGIEPEDARFILPTATETELIVTGNFREFMHFLKLRLDKHAQWEIREVANQIFGYLKRVAPIIFNEGNITKYE